jgi:hypothetical protein
MIHGGRTLRPNKVAGDKYFKALFLGSAPIILGLRKQAWAKVVVAATGQHHEMLDQVLS